METTDTNELTSSLVNSILSGNAVEAQKVFNDIAAAKASGALEARKVEIAQSLYKDQTTDTADATIETDVTVDTATDGGVEETSVETATTEE